MRPDPKTLAEDVDVDERDRRDWYVAEALYDEVVAFNIDVRGGVDSPTEWTAWDDLADMWRDHYHSLAVTARVAGLAAGLTQGGE